MNEETQLPPVYISELSTEHTVDVIKGVDTTSLRPSSNYWLAGELFAILRLIRVDKPLASAVFLFSGIYVVGGLSALISFTTLRAALATIFIVASSFALNDVQDIMIGLTSPIDQFRLAESQDVMASSYPRSSL